MNRPGRVSRPPEPEMPVTKAGLELRGDLLRQHSLSYTADIARVERQAARKALREAAGDRDRREARIAEALTALIASADDYEREARARRVWDDGGPTETVIRGIQQYREALLAAPGQAGPRADGETGT